MGDEGEVKTTRIISVGCLGGGASYFSSENNVGLYAWLKDRVSDGRAPDHVVFHGEALPEISRFVTRAGMSKNLILQEFINDLDGAVIFIKPYLSRIAETIRQNNAKTGQGSGITYIWGPSDIENRKREYDLIVTMFEYSPERIVDSMKSYRDKVEIDINGSIESLMRAREKYREAILLLESKAAAPGQDAKAAASLRKGIDNYKAEIESIDGKLFERKTELEDYKHIHEKYTALLRYWARSNQGKDIDELAHTFKDRFDSEFYELYAMEQGSSGKPPEVVRNEVQAVLEKTRAQMEKLDPENDRVEYEKLETMVKNLGNLVTKYSYEGISDAKQKASQENEVRLEREWRFTHNIPGTPELTRIAEEISRATIIASIKDAFGRRMDVNVVTSNSESVSINGLDVVVANKPSNSSHAFTHTREQEIRGLLRGRNVSNMNIVITSRSPSSHVNISAEGTRGDSTIYHLASCPFVDPQKLKEANNGKLKTWFTNLASKTVPSSGFDELEVQNFSVKHTFHTSNELSLLAGKEMRFQARVLAKAIRTIATSRLTLDQLDGGLDSKDRLQLGSKLPSELRRKKIAQYSDDVADGDSKPEVQVETKWLLPRALRDLGVDINDKQSMYELAKAAETMDYDAITNIKVAEWLRGYIGLRSTADSMANRVNFLMLTDMHIGGPGSGYPNKRLLSSISRYVMDNYATKRVPYVLVLGGDDIEGFLGNYKYEPYIDGRPSNEYLHQRFLIREGLAPGSEEFEARMDRYKSWLVDKQPMHLSYDQASAFATLAHDLLLHAESIIIIPGNHLNNSFSGKELDEADMLYDAVRSELPASMHNKVKAYSGGIGTGTGPIELDRGLVFKAVHKGSAKNEEKLNGRNTVTLVGHHHVHDAETVDNGMVMKGLHGQGFTHFPEEIGMKPSEKLRGMSTLAVTYTEDGPLSYTDTPISLGLLESLGYIRRDPIIEKFEKGLAEPPKVKSLRVKI